MVRGSETTVKSSTSRPSEAATSLVREVALRAEAAAEASAIGAPSCSTETVAATPATLGVPIWSGSPSSWSSAERAEELMTGGTSSEEMGASSVAASRSEMRRDACEESCRREASLLEARLMVQSLVAQCDACSAAAMSPAVLVGGTVTASDDSW